MPQPHTPFRTLFSSVLRRPLPALVLSLWLALWSQAAMAETSRYLSELPDLPLMPGLEEVVGAGVVFDKPGGRIVEVYAQGAVTAQDLRGFYAATLPQLGWRAAGTSSYLREGERLEIVILSESAPLAVRFTLSPE